jgi:hypothetical protein
MACVQGTRGGLGHDEPGIECVFGFESIDPRVGTYTVPERERR